MTTTAAVLEVAGRSRRSRRTPHPRLQRHGWRRRYIAAGSSAGAGAGGGAGAGAGLSGCGGWPSRRRGGGRESRQRRRHRRSQGRQGSRQSGDSAADSAGQTDTTPPPAAQAPPALTPLPRRHRQAPRRAGFASAEAATAPGAEADLARSSRHVREAERARRVVGRAGAGEVLPPSPAAASSLDSRSRSSSPSPSASSRLSVPSTPGAAFPLAYTAPSG